MVKQALFEIIQRADTELRFAQDNVNLDSETRAEIVTARRLLRKLKVGVLREESSILLGDSWSFGALRLILPVINTLEKRGISVLYASLRQKQDSRSEVDVEP